MATVEEHEILVHLLHGDQGKAFLTCFGRVTPDYEGRRLRLTAFGPIAAWATRQVMTSQS
jgi:hypothetical protein